MAIDTRFANIVVSAHPIGSYGEKWWLIVNKSNNTLSVYANAILIFSTEGIARQFISDNYQSGIAWFQPDITDWRSFVADYGKEFKEVALDWKGQGRGWYKHGGRYKLR